MSCVQASPILSDNVKQQLRGKVAGQRQKGAAAEAAAALAQRPQDGGDGDDGEAVSRQMTILLGFFCSLVLALAAEATHQKHPRVGARVCVMCV